MIGGWIFLSRLQNYKKHLMQYANVAWSASTLTGEQSTDFCRDLSAVKETEL